MTKKPHLFIFFIQCTSQRTCSVYNHVRKIHMGDLKVQFILTKNKKSGQGMKYSNLSYLGAKKSS